MGQGPAVTPTYRSLTITDKDGHPTSFHSIPIEQFVHLVDDRGSCLCGPQVTRELDANCEVVISHYGHWPLDARFYDGFHEDWGEDGPVSSRV
ncbi:MAG TPA: hypothetical protein VF377_08825 [Acidimicrobiia bacterium]